LWDPEEWQLKSQNDGIDWTFHPDYWIPVLVSGIDDQAEHNESGIPLTFEMAIFGNYAAYYDDKYLPKPINAIARNDLQFDVKQVFDWFKQSYNNSGTEAMHTNSFEDSAAVKEKNIEQPTIKASSTYQEEEEYLNCGSCGDPHSPDDTWFDEGQGAYLCEYCRESNYKWSDWHDSYIPNEYAVWCNSTEEYYDMEASDIQIIECPNCAAIHVSRESWIIKPDQEPEKHNSETTVTPEGCNKCKSTNEDN